MQRHRSPVPTKTCGDAATPSPDVCPRVQRHRSPVPTKSKERVIGRNSNESCKIKERPKDKETKVSPPKITEQTNADISVQS